MYGYTLPHLPHLPTNSVCSTPILDSGIYVYIFLVECIFRPSDDDEDDDYSTIFTFRSKSLHSEEWGGGNLNGQPWI